ncbi:chemotaxis protein CheA [Nocardioides solisilvae]|uniref:chemotaxis protein CheA n=1 Tax=Nocardioides solisilvae TaxID=1542435 RepID=UPI000D7463BC|nr:chemotaxis protein CheA [Nocardioides solisilvae]
MDDDAEIIAEFLVESHENLDQLDRDLVELEGDPGSPELLSSIFRTIHTIKGTSGFLALHRLEALTHVGENLLATLRDGERTMTTEVAEVLLAMVDAVRRLLAAVEATGSDVAGDVDVDSVVASLRAVLEETPPTPAASPEPAPGSEPEATEVAAASAPEAPAPAEGVPDAVPAAPVVLAAPAGPVVTVAPAVPLDVAAPAPVPAAPESLLAPVAAAPSAAAPDAPFEPAARSAVDSTVRVDVDLLDSLVQLVGELVLTRNQILRRTEAREEDLELVRAAQRLDQVASELQEGVMRTRMQPIGHVWSKMPRIVRDLAHQLERQVQLDLEGHETELDRSLLEALRDPLTHLVRNAIDHGIETPAARLAAGKPATGRLLLRARHESGQVVVEITDDGKGIDPEAIAAAALARGVVTREELARMEPRDVLALVFEPGFSTAAVVTNVSGRGVGMDVVRTNIERIGGTVDVQSVVGEGTTCRVRIPLTLAIIPALLVQEGAERYALPQVNLVELVRVEGESLATDVEVVAGAPVLRLRGELLPLLPLGTALGVDVAAPTLPLDERDGVTVVVVQADGVRYGLCVAEVHDTQEIVVKPLGRQLKALGTYAGATIMGDGRVALILDVAGLAHAHGIVPVPVSKVEVAVKRQETTPMLVLEVVPGRRAALPLHEVSRLEEIEVGRLEGAGRAEAVQYRDGILPLVRLSSLIGLPPAPDGEEERATLSVVVHEDGEHRVGLVIDRVVDVVDTVLRRSEVGRRDGVLGSAVIDGRVTDLLDLDAVVTAAGVA